MALAVGSFTQFALSLSDNFWEPYFMAISETPLNGLVMVAFPTIYVSPTVGGLQAVALKLDGAGGVAAGAEKRLDDCSDNKTDVSIDVSGLKTDGTMVGVYYEDDDSNQLAQTIGVNTSTLALTPNAQLIVPTGVPAASHKHSIDRIDDTHLFAVHVQFTASIFDPGTVGCYKLTESSGTLSASSRLNLSSNTKKPANRAYGVVLSASRAFVLWDDDGGDAKVALVDISGANPTLVDGPDTIEASAVIGNPGSNLPRAVKVSASRIICEYSVGASRKMKVIENNADVINQGAALTLSGVSGSVTIGRQNENGCIIAHSNDKVETISIASDMTLAQTGDVVSLTPPAASFRECQIALAQIVGLTVSWIVVAQDTNDDMWAAEVTDELPPVEVDPTGGSINRAWLGRAMPRTNRHRPRPLFGLRRRF